jgi:hypothetical protein
MHDTAPRCTVSRSNLFLHRAFANQCAQAPVNVGGQTLASVILVRAVLCRII